MASIWGSTALKILVGSLKPGVTAGTISEIDLLPDPADLSAITTVLQQGGHKRLRVKAKLYVSSMAAYNAFVDDLNLGTSRVLTISDTGISAAYVIESLGDPDFVQSDCIEFDIVWVEV